MATASGRRDPSPNTSFASRTDLKAQVLAPSDSEYVAAEDSYWSNTAKLGPACIVRPDSVEQVSEALTALVQHKEKFAVRSGGHAPTAGSNNIHDGVTVDLTLLNTIRYDEVSTTVTFGPGARWKHVFEELQKYDRVVAGGREGGTGVAGFLLGGGNTWETAREGFACDNVIAYEVVLADGQIVTASKDANADLFLALKGGWNNFGIVTKFVMKTIPNVYIWGGLTVISNGYLTDVIEATANFTSSLVTHPDSNLVVLIGYSQALKDIVISGALVEARGVEDSPAFEQWLALPMTTNLTSRKTMVEMGLEEAFPSNQYTTWFTITVKNDKKIMSKAADLHRELVKELLAKYPEGNFATQLIFQPLPVLFAQRSVAAGGNVLGLERNKQDGIILQINAMMTASDQGEFAYVKVKAAIEALKDFASSTEGGLFDWVYMNYADASQDVIGSYGKKNVDFMKGVSSKYDPCQVFQELCVGGFKVSSVQ